VICDLCEIIRLIIVSDCSVRTASVYVALTKHDERRRHAAEKYKVVFLLSLLALSKYRAHTVVTVVAVILK